MSFSCKNEVGYWIFNTKRIVAVGLLCGVTFLESFVGRKANINIVGCQESPLYKRTQSAHLLLLPI